MTTIKPVRKAVIPAQGGNTGSRFGYALFACYQGNAEGNAADCGQADHSVYY